MSGDVKPACRGLRTLAPYFGAVLIWMSTTAMHIPDGYLSPLSCLVMLLLVLPFWVVGMRSIRDNLRAQNVPLVALMAAFSFVVMMFNIPLPGGTSGHAVGGALAAILLGPQTATIAISMALIIQALFFGDGGILAIGANSFNIAVVVPYIAAAVYHFIAQQSPPASRRRLVGGAIGGWLGMTTAALLTGVEFGLQPMLFHSADGTPLYAPYPLAIAVPAMVLPHAFVASSVEGLLTALVILYLQRSNVHMLGTADASPLALEQSRPRKLLGVWILLTALVLASPLGLLAPGTAWGEWNAAELAARGFGAIPVGLRQLTGLWGAPLAGYRVAALGDVSMGYMLSGALGVLVVAIVAWLLLSALIRGRPSPADGRP